MRITFHGATREVTGSAHLVEIGNRRILLDCGLFDSDRLNPNSPNRGFTFDPRAVDATVISHAHNDHIGRLPLLLREGFRGPIYLTPATGSITAVMLRDSARIQKEETRNGTLRDEDGRVIEPLYDIDDVEWTVENFRKVPYEETIELFPEIRLTFRDAGHVLGSAMVQLDFLENGESRRFVFTGDIGRRHMGPLPDPRPIQDIDVLVSESTYGGKTLDPYDTLLKQLAAIVARAHRLRSRIVIPAFSLGRTQRMVFAFQELFANRKVRPIPIFVDSPLSLRLTDIHRDFPEAYRKESLELMAHDPMLFGSKYVEYCETWDDSRRLNSMPGPIVIISSSGMCDAGRIRHHLRHTIEDPDNAVVIVSYQAEGTLGRQIAEGKERIKIMDNWYNLDAAVYVLDGFSGHGDRDDLISWFEQTGGGIESAFLVHGEPESMESLAPELQKFVKTPVVIPERMQTFEV